MHATVRHVLLALAGASLCTAPVLVSAADTEISVSASYVRLVPPGTPTSAAFMKIQNNGSVERKLIRAESTIAKAVELHNHINDNGMMKMRQIKEIAIPAKGETSLKPGSYHVMLIDLKQALKEGEKVALTLVFDDGSSQKIEAPIMKPQTSMSNEAASKDHKHMMH